MKPFYKSRTLWMNTIALALVALNHDAGHLVPPDIEAALILVLNIAMRFVTNTGLAVS